jgi:uncharacterized lipoprotein YddW (UPF0748 family)
LTLLLLVSPFSASANDFADFRGLWISRFEYNANSASSIAQVINNAADFGTTDILFQVRARGDAFYDSSVEPRAEGTSAAIDPLQIAIDTAHARGVRLHAWLNTVPLWRDSPAPASPTHSFYNTDPSFRLTDINGVVENPSSPFGAYATANPVLDEMHQHIGNVVTDIATNYQVDGIHLDYIRWLGPTSAAQGFRPDFNFLPHDPLSHSLFQAATGLDGSNIANAAQYRAFVTNRITDLVSHVRDQVDAAESLTGRSIDLSAAVWRDPDIARNERLQDYESWLEQDLLDIVMPMIYLTESNNHLFLPNLLNTLSIPTSARVAPGLGTYLHTNSAGGVDLTIDQLQTLYDNGAGGATLFSYGSLFTDSLAAARRQAINEFYESIAPAAPLVLADFEQGEAPFGWSPTFSGSTSGVLAGSTIDRTTAEAFAGAASQQIDIVGEPGGWFLRHVSGEGAPADAAAPSGNQPFAATGSLGLWIKSFDQGLSVSIALDDPGTADRSTAREIIGDGQWRLYEWSLDDNAQWEGWITGDGQITGPTVTLDSLQFWGAGNATLWIDQLVHNPTGSLLSEIVPGDYNRDGVVGEEDFAVWRAAFGSTGPALAADGNADGVVDSADYVVWRDNLGRTATAALELAPTAVPEPTGWAALAIAASLLLVRRPRRYEGR